MKRNLCCLVIMFFMLLGRVCVVEASDILSEEEKSWLEESNQIKYSIAYPSSITPLAYSYFSSSLKGVINDISQEFNRLTDLWLYPIATNDVDQNRSIIDYSIVDVVITGKKDEYAGMYYSNPIHEFEYSYFVKPSSYFKSIEDVSHAKVGYVDNDDLIEDYLDNVEDCFKYPNYMKIYTALMNDEVEAIFVPSELFSYQSSLHDLRQLKFPDYKESAWYFMSDNPVLISILNKVMLHTQTVEEYADSFIKHENALNSKLYSLDKQTYEWLFYSNPVLTIGIYDMAPFMYYNAEIDGLSGLLATILKNIETNFGVKFDLIYGEYEELRHEYENGNLDILPVFNEEDAYTIYQGQINAYGNFDRLLVHDQLIQDNQTRLGSLTAILMQGGEIPEENLMVSHRISSLMEKLVSGEISYVILDPIFLDYVGHYDVYHKGKIGKYSFGLMVQDKDYYSQFFDAISEYDFQGDSSAERYATLLATEMYLYEMSQLKEDLFSMQRQRLIWMTIFVVTASAMVLLYRQRYLDKKTEYLKYTDYATGLLNRLGYQKQIEQMMSKRQKFTFMIFDIDYFKSINDTYGHMVGDEVIVHVANVLMVCCGKKDVLCRLGGDEFIACVMTDDLDEVSELIRRIQDELVNYVSTEGQTLKVTASIGVTVYDGRDCEIEEIYHDADMALYRSKRNGRNQFNIFSK